MTQKRANKIVSVSCRRVFHRLREKTTSFFKLKFESPLKRTLLYGGLVGAKYMKNSRDFFPFSPFEKKTPFPKTPFRYPKRNRDKFFFALLSAWRYFECPREFPQQPFQFLLFVFGKSIFGGIQETHNYFFKFTKKITKHHTSPYKR
jgi:hypothetical protein